MELKEIIWAILMVNNYQTHLEKDDRTMAQEILEAVNRMKVHENIEAADHKLSHPLPLNPEPTMAKKPPTKQKMFPSAYLLPENILTEAAKITAEDRQAREAEAKAQAAKLAEALEALYLARERPACDCGTCVIARNALAVYREGKP